MEKTVYLDTGPLVALFHKRDQFHPWVKKVLSDHTFRFITCEAVLTETLFVSQNSPRAVAAIAGMMENNILEIQSAITKDPTEVLDLMNKYHDQNTSLADVSLVTLYNNEQAPIFTTDSDFLVYRDSRGNAIDLISPYKS
ncbi:type II toxin-antitoxin system VapC family toxin [Gracilimonas tropica]|uniref:type II toxin-antitoxin system VapC family toxin n=1 Tax=Gracilimonas tropica TaxID=454600 RepID=UPI00036617C3|nr:PIN domain-containing protein [Gracilimonas tropica]